MRQICLHFLFVLVQFILIYFFWFFIFDVVYQKRVRLTKRQAPTMCFECTAIFFFFSFPLLNVTMHCFKIEARTRPHWPPSFYFSFIFFYFFLFFFLTYLFGSTVVLRTSSLYSQNKEKKSKGGLRGYLFSFLVSLSLFRFLNFFYCYVERPSLLHF